MARVRSLLVTPAVLLALLTSAHVEAAADRPVEVHGHRGARALVTENTIAAFDHALAVGADVLELDLVVTKDDHLVVLHDPVLAPGTCQGRAEPIAVRSLTLAELQGLRCRVPKDARRFPKQRQVVPGRVPSLDEVLTHVLHKPGPGAKTVEFNIEAKTIPGHPDLFPPVKLYARMVSEALKRHHVAERTIIQSFDHDILRELAKLAPGVRRSALVAETHLDYVAVARSARAQIVSPHHEWITKHDVEQLHAVGVEVVPWTLNTEAAWRRALDMGVDGIITDDPGALIAWLKTQQKR